MSETSQRYASPARLLIAILTCLLVGLLVSGCEPATGLRSTYPAEPPQAAGAAASLRGAYVAWTVPAMAVPPTRAPSDPLAPGNHVLGVDCLSYLGSGGDVGATGLWDNPKVIDWGPIDRCISTAATRNVKLPDGSTIAQPVILTLPGVFADTGSRYYRSAGRGAPGTEGNPFGRLHLPPWMQNDTYRFTFTVPSSGNVYQSIRYDGQFKERMLELLRTAGARYNSNSQVAAIRVAVGVQGESQPSVPCQTYWDTTSPEGPDSPDCKGDTAGAVLAAHEALVSCDAYMDFVTDLSTTALAAFPDKPVTSIVDVSPCASLSGKSFRRNLYKGEWAKRPIGVSMNSLDIDLPDADEAPGNVLAPWNKYTVGRTMRSMDYPMIFEYGTQQASDVAMYWTTLSGAGNGGDYLLHHSPWNGSYSSLTWEVIDYWVASDQRAWLVFRDKEYPTYDYVSGFGTSGTIGDWGKYLRLENPQDAPQACEAGLRAAAKRANDTAAADGRLNIDPACPGIALPAPAAQAGPDAEYNRMFNRQARKLDGRELRIVVDEDWTHAGRAYPVTVTVSYLNAGKDQFEIVLPGRDGSPARHAIQKTGDGNWKRVSWSQDVRIGNRLDGVFMRILDDGAGAEYLHEVYVSLAGTQPHPEPTATPTMAFTSTLTPSPTHTPSPTDTPAPTATVTPTATPAATLPATDTPTATPNPTNTATVAPSPTVTHTTQPTGTATRAATSIPTPTPTSTSTAAPTVTTAPAATFTTTVTVALTRSPTATPTAAPPASATPQQPAACAPKLEGSLALGESPKALAAGPGGFYAGLYDASSVALVGNDGRAALWRVASGPGHTNGLAIADGVLVASNRDAGSVTLHDAATGARLATLGVGSLPWGVTAAHGRAYVANFGSGTVSIIDLAEQRVLTTAFVGPSPVTLVTLSAEAYAVHLDGRVTRLAPDGRILARTKTSAADVRGLAADAIRNKLYAGSKSGYLVVLDAGTLAEERRIALPGPAYSLAVNPGTGRIFAVDAGNNRLYAVEAGGSAVTTLPLPPQGGDQGGQGLAVYNNRVAVANLGARSLTFVNDAVCVNQLTPQASPSAPAATRTPTRTPSPSATPVRPTATATPSPTTTPTRQPTTTPVTQGTTPTVVRAKIEIVWPHGGAPVREANRANITAYLFAGDGTDPRTVLASPPCNWSPTVRLWAAVNAQPAREVATGQKRIVREGGRVFPAWDFNDLDVSAARDPANKISFYVTVDGVATLHNIWVHAADARTLFPQQDVPVTALRTTPSSVDARIQIVWPHDSAPVQDAALANISAFLFHEGTLNAIAPQTPWAPGVRLHWSLNNNTEAAPGKGVLGLPRRITAANGVIFLGWDFNDVNVSAAREPLNRLYFWVTVDGKTSYSNIWAHGTDARTLFPQPDVPNSCQ